MKSTDKIRVQVLPSRTVADFRQGDFSQIQPDQWVAVCPPAMVPKMGVVKMMRVEGGLYQPVILALPSLVHAGQWKAEIYGCSWYSVVRLAMADFVQYHRPSPRTTCIVLESYFEHLQATKDDFHFWTPERIARLEAVRLKKSDLESDGEDDDGEGTPDIPLVAQFLAAQNQPRGDGDAENRTGDTQNAPTPPSTPSATLGVGRKNRNPTPHLAAAV